MVGTESSFGIARVHELGFGDSLGITHCTTHPREVTSFISLEQAWDHRRIRLDWPGNGIGTWNQSGPISVPNQHFDSTNFGKYCYNRV